MPAAIRYLALFAASLSLSAVWIVANPQTGNKWRPDAILFEGIAANLADGNGYSFDKAPPYRPEITRSPFLPAMAAVVFAVSGKKPAVVLWLNAVLIALSVAFGYAVARRIFESEKAAHVGAWIACLTPQVSGSANAFLTEASAMFQVCFAVWLILLWREHKNSRWTAAISAALGLTMASLVLNRPNYTIPVLAAGMWALLFVLGNSGWRSQRGWIVSGVFCFALGAPVLGWSARNASVGLAFSPMGTGGGAGYVHEVRRNRDLLLEPNEEIPSFNEQFWSHFRKPMGPEQLLELDKKNMEWFKELAARRWGRMLLSIPVRVLGLFSNRAVCVYNQPWPNRMDDVFMPIAKWTSRALWLLSTIGFLLLWRRPDARSIWIIPIASLVFFHSFTACNPRYLTPLLPLLMPYAGVAAVRSFETLKHGFASFKSKAGSADEKNR